MALKPKAVLGFAARARKIACGDFAVTKAVSARKAKVIVVDESASLNTKCEWKKTCGYKGIPYLELEGMGNAVGKENCMVIAILDRMFADMLDIRPGDDNKTLIEKTGGTGDNA